MLQNMLVRTFAAPIKNSALTQTSFAMVLDTVKMVLMKQLPLSVPVSTNIDFNRFACWSKEIEILSLLIAFYPREKEISKIYPTSTHLYLFLSLVNSPLSLSISLSIRIHAHLFQSRFIYLCLFYVYPPLFLYTTLSIHLYFFIPLSIQIDDYLFLSHC